MVLWSWLPAQEGNAQPAVKMESGQQLQVLYLIDTTNHVTENQLISETLPFDSRWVARSSGKCSLWIKTSLPENGNYCMQTRLGETVQIFILKNDELTLEQNGRYLPPSLRSVRAESKYICIGKVSSTQAVFIHIPDFDFHYSDTEFIVRHQTRVLDEVTTDINGSFLITGAILIIVMCSFTIFIFFLDYSYLWFTIYIICAYTMSNLDLLGYLFGDRLPMLFLDSEILQIYFVACPVSLIGLCISFFRIFSRSVLWSRVFFVLLIFALICLITIPFDPFINSQLILWLNLTTVILVASYAAMSFFGNHYNPAGYFLLAFVVPIIASIMIALDFLSVFQTKNLSHVNGFALLIQSIILFIGVVKRYQRMNEDLIRVTLTKWEKEHEAKIFQLRNTELISQNEVIEKQKQLLSEQAKKLEEMNATKDKLLSVLSHDLRAPIGNLRSILSLLTRQAVTPDEFREISEKLRYDVDTAYNMLDDVLHWVRSQYAGIVPNPVNFKLTEVIQEVIHISMPLASEKHVKLELQASGDDMVHADRDHIHIIIRNLLSNAIKFTRSSSSVIVTIRSNGKRVEVCVRDQGMGMSQEIIDKIIKGVKVESNRGTKGEKGTGLGLLLCREFVALNGGALKFESRPGEGTMVSFTLQAV
jgi:signal transduction histidine kinase